MIKKLEPKIEHIHPQLFIGKKIKNTFEQDKTVELWRSFMPNRNEIKNKIGKELYSIENYPAGFFNDFNPEAEFEKWAAVEVHNFNAIPDGMGTFTSPGGLYAAFLHIGTAAEGSKTYKYIFEEWLPNSIYYLDKRPHFAVMGEKYRPDDPDSEEEVLIPIK